MTAGNNPESRHVIRFVSTPKTVGRLETRPERSSFADTDSLWSLISDA
jgi:hypothetical protein